jgi:hypothetical protein
MKEGEIGKEKVQTYAMEFLVIANINRNVLLYVILRLNESLTENCLIVNCQSQYASKNNAAVKEGFVARAKYGCGPDLVWLSGRTSLVKRAKTIIYLRNSRTS